VAAGHSKESLKPIAGAARAFRHRLHLRGEIALAILPTITVLAMLILLERLSEQRLLFASLASSAFLIYLDPHHGTNQVRTLVGAHLLAATLGLLAFILFGHGYLAGGIAMVAAILLMIVLDTVHPPAVSTSLIFAIRSGAENEFFLFALALGITAVLVFLQRSAVWVLARVDREWH
jgi:CBS-domain-containing membrane protein